MTAHASSLTQLRDLYQQESAELRQAFERTGDGAAAIRRRATVVDNLVRQIWSSLPENADDCPNIALIAAGGFGRKELFPYSDVDVLYLCASDAVERDFHETI